MKIRKYIFLFFVFLSYIPVLAQVDTAWVRRYNGLANSTDVATALAVDDNGNIYVSGHSWNSGTAYDYATIKYSSDGDTLWVRLYNGPGNNFDEVRALTIDGNGFVYVTGWSEQSEWNADYATIKYSPNGDTLWARRYNGPGNYFDAPSALELMIAVMFM